MSKTSKNNPKKKEEQTQENAPINTSEFPQDLTVAENPRELLSNPAVAPQPLDSSEDMRVDLFKE